MLILATAAQAFSGSGAGTTGDPYQITTTAQFDEIQDSLDSDYLLMNDLDFTGVNIGQYAAIGSWYTNAFRGMFDGQGYTLSNILINDNMSALPFGYDHPVGLFGYVSGASAINPVVIKNLYIDGITITPTQNVLNGGLFSVGTLFGYGDGYIILENIFINDALIEVQGDEVGGVMGDCDGANSFNAENITWEGIIRTPTTFSWVTQNFEVGGFGRVIEGANGDKIKNVQIIGTINNRDPTIEVRAGGLASELVGDFLLENINIQMNITSNYNGTPNGGMAGVFLDALSSASSINMTNVVSNSVLSFGNEDENYAIAASGTTNNTYTNTDLSAIPDGSGATNLTDEQMRTPSTFSAFDTNIWLLRTGYYPLLKAGTPTNTAPTIDAASPSSPTSIHAPASTIFNVVASDAENDSLSYQWYKDSVDIIGETNPSYTYTVVLGDAGNYNITAVVTDGIETVQTEWEVTVTEGYQATYESEDIDDIVVDGFAIAIVTVFSLAVIIGLILTIIWTRGTLRKK